MNNYTPISCSFYDELEALATRKERVVIEYYDSINDKITVPPVIKTVEGFIKNLFTKSKEEFVELDNTFTIRLDKIVAVNGKVMRLYC